MRSGFGTAQCIVLALGYLVAVSSCLEVSDISEKLLQKLIEKTENLEQKEKQHRQEVSFLKETILRLEERLDNHENGCNNRIAEQRKELMTFTRQYCVQSSVKNEALNAETGGVTEQTVDVTEQKTDQADEEITPVGKVPTKERIRRQAVENKVAFFANIHASVVSNLGAHQDIAFDRNITNVGNAYSPRHGVFTAPVPGVYVFHATISGQTSTINNHNYVNFDCNGHVVATFRIDKADQSSQMVVLNLNKGDEVSLKNVHVNDAIYGATWSTFAGFLLYQDFADSIVIGK